MILKYLLTLLLQQATPMPSYNVQRRNFNASKRCSNGRNASADGRHSAKQFYERFYRNKVTDTTDKLQKNVIIFFCERESREFCTSIARLVVPYFGRYRFVLWCLQSNSIRQKKYTHSSTSRIFGYGTCGKDNGQFLTI